MVSSRTRPGSRELKVLARAALTDVTFVQVAGGALADGHRLALRDLAPTTVWLLHGALERVGHMATGTFLDLWWDEESRLSWSALGAVFGQADPQAQLLGDPLLTVRSPVISGSGIQYQVEVLNGTLPRQSGSCVLFVGPGGPRPGITPPDGWR